MPVEDISRIYDWRDLAAQALVAPLHAKLTTIKLLGSSWREDRTLHTWARLDELSIERAVEIAFDCAVYAEALTDSPLAGQLVDWSRAIGTISIEAAARDLAAQSTELLCELLERSS